MGCHSLLQGIFPTQELNPGLMSSSLAAGFFTTSATWEALNIIYLLTIIEFKNFPQNKLAEAWLKISSDVLKVKVKMKFTQSCPTLFDPMECSLPESCVHGILQARILEWVAIPFSRGSSRPWDGTWVSCVAGTFFAI